MYHTWYLQLPRIHCLVLVSVPPPHVAEHTDQSPKSLYPPSTEQEDYQEMVVIKY